MFTTTNTILLEGLTNPANHQVWAEFDERYRPILQGFAARLGLGENDAAEAAQRALIRFAEEYREGKYERTRGRLRSWLFAIGQGQIQKLRREQARRHGQRGESILGELPAQDESEQIFEGEWRRAILDRGMEELRRDTRLDEKTLLVLERISLQGRGAKEVAEDLGMSVNAVYVAKHRALERLRHILQGLEEDF